MDLWLPLVDIKNTYRFREFRLHHGLINDCRCLFPLVDFVVLSVFVSFSVHADRHVCSAGLWRAGQTPDSDEWCHHHHRGQVGVNEVLTLNKSLKYHVHPVNNEWMFGRHGFNYKSNVWLWLKVASFYIIPYGTIAVCHQRLLFKELLSFSLQHDNRKAIKIQTHIQTVCTVDYNITSFLVTSKQFLNKFKNILAIHLKSSVVAGRLGPVSFSQTMFACFRAENYWWRGQNKSTLKVGQFPRNVVTSVAGLSAHDISRPLKNSFIHTGHGDSNPQRRWGFPDRIDE